MTRKPSFLRLFATGFAGGAAALIAVHAVTPAAPGWVPSQTETVAR